MTVENYVALVFGIAVILGAWKLGTFGLKNHSSKKHKAKHV